MLTQARLKELLRYDPDTGNFTWLVRVGGIVTVGNRAGTAQKGYIRIGLASKGYQAHRLAYLYMTGAWPNAQIDHVNGVRSDNRWQNLREATHSENQCNVSAQANNAVGFKGVRKSTTGPNYQISVRKNHVVHEVCGFQTAEIANEFAVLMRETLHGKFANHNRALA